MSLAGFAFAASPGRHLAVLGPSERGAHLLDAAARSLAAAHRPGSVEFVLAPFVAATDGSPRRWHSRCAAPGTRRARSTAAGLKELVADPDLADTYVIGFGLDTGPSIGLAPLLREVRPAASTCWAGWRGLRRFGEDTGGGSARDEVAGLVLLNVPAADAALLLDDAELDWQPRPDRALLHDRHTGRTSLIVPFVHSGRSG